jgi:hypothetical protein
VVIFTALFLLARLKKKFLPTRRSSDHRIFISAFMIAWKVICDDTHVLKKVLVYRQANRYTLKEVNQMGREICSYLGWLFASMSKLRSSKPSPKR